jgi:predicted ATPase/DNA-binding CsgD family transcriptional regulator/transcriptional regulator with XRE-family HTH domain
LRQFRLRAGLSQAMLAERAGLATAAVAALEQGARRAPYPRTLGALAEALQLSPDERKLLASAARTAHAPAAEPALAQPRSTPKPSVRRGPLIARERDLQRIRSLLVDSNPSCRAARLVSLTGVGGVGKTSLAVAVAADLVPHFPDGVWLVELAPVVDSGQVPRVVGAALGVVDATETDPEAALLTFLQDRCVLVVLDNCEHLIDACAQLVSRLLDTCPAVQVLVTSREPLQIPGEQQLRINPLPIPEEVEASSLEGLASNPSVRLLVAYAQAASLDFCLSPDVAAAIAGICVRLEGIPLALELAAASLRVLTPGQLLDRLGDAFGLLSTRARAAPTRQQTLRATLDWSYVLLTDAEQAVFRRLGVFANGCGIEAAETVCALNDLDASDVLNIVARLADKSLVCVQTAAGEARYRLLEPLRQYALQCLAGSSETAAVESRHTAHYVALAEQAAAELGGPEQVFWLERLDCDIENLRAALRRCAQAGNLELELRLTVALRPYWETRGQLAEGRRCLEHAITCAEPEMTPTRLRRDALFGAGRLSQWQADLSYSEERILQSLELSRAIGDAYAIAEELAWLGTVYRRRGADEKARVALHEALTIGRALGTSTACATAFTCEGVRLANLGDLFQARQLLETSLAQFRVLGDLRWQAITLMMLGEATLEMDSVEQARPLLVQALNILRSIGDPVLALFAMEGLANAEVRAAQFVRAARWLGATQVLRERLGARRALPNWRGCDRAAAEIRHALGEATLADALAAGRDLSLADLTAEATATASESEPAQASAPVYERLTPRERQVADLLRQGCSDREIAARLSITTGTAGLHVHRLLRKLELHSRWQVADLLSRNAALAS